MRESGRTTRSGKGYSSKAILKKHWEPPAPSATTGCNGNLKVMLCPTRLRMEVLSSGFAGFVTGWKPETFARETLSIHAILNSTTVQTEVCEQRQVIRSM